MQNASKDHFLIDAAAVSAGPDWIAALRRAGLDRFQETPFPHTRMEEWRHTNIVGIVGTPYRSLLEPAPHGIDRGGLAPFLHGGGAWHEVVCVDGFADPALSSPGALPGGVYAGGLRAALDGPHADALRAHLNAHLKPRNAYTALNSAFLLDGAFVHVPRNTRVAEPIHIVFATSGREAGTASHPRVLIVLEEGAEAAVVVSHAGHAGAPDHLNNVVEEIAIGPNARLNHYKIVLEGAAGNHLATTEATLSRDSRLASHTVTLDGQVVRNQLCVALAGEGAEVSLVGLYLNDRDRLVDNALRIVHEAPNCRSRILYKGILDGKSRAVFTGHVYVHPEAQKTDSNQLSSNLILSDGAGVDAKPQLEIFADDVKCTHGATVGSPPEEVIFYFRSRGIDEATARGMLTYGFADEIVEEVDIAPLRRWLNDHIYRKYSPKQ